MRGRGLEVRGRRRGSFVLRRDAASCPDRGDNSSFEALGSGVHRRPLASSSAKLTLADSAHVEASGPFLSFIG